MAAYRSNAERAEDNNSSGYMLVIVGIIGIVCMVFIFINNPFNMALFNKCLTCGVMGALFVLFTVMGFLSLRSAKFFREKANEDNTLLKEITKWCEENLDAEKIDDGMRNISLAMVLENAAEESMLDDLQITDQDIEDLEAIDGVSESDSFSRNDEDMNAYSDEDNFEGSEDTDESLTETEIVLEIDDMAEHMQDENAVFDQEDDESQDIYFARVQYIKDRINKQFVNLNQEFLDDFVEDYYEKVFEGKNN
ncbi:MAG: hypothetical protein K6B41_14775 [Butyrivibrio sp.]|nr:hypothetical protein [Butyrivibrio sp.]